VVLGLFSAHGAVANAVEPRARSAGDHGLRIGQLAPQTGSEAGILPSLTTPVTMAVDEINAGGGVLGKPVTYTQADDGSEAVAAKSGLGVLRAQHVDAVMGPASSETALGILHDVRDAGLLMCSGSNTAAGLSTANSNGYYFRTEPSDRFQGPALARVVLREGHSRVAILARDDAYGRGLRSSLKALLTKGGAAVVADVLYDPELTAFGPEVQDAVEAQPDAVIIAGFERDGSHILIELLNQGLGPQQLAIYGADGLRTTELARLVDLIHPGGASGLRGTSPSVAPAGAHNNFADTFKTTGVDPVYSPYYYDCTILTALAAEKARSHDPAKMKSAFASNTRGRERCASYVACKSLLDRGKTIDYQGASAGFPHMNRFGESEPNAGVYDVWSFDNSEQITVGPPDTQIRVR
jgi:branched-chain amino acid transport system substrate-binding protein